MPVTVGAAAGSNQDVCVCLSLGRNVPAANPPLLSQSAIYSTSSCRDLPIGSAIRLDDRLSASRLPNVCTGSSAPAEGWEGEPWGLEFPLSIKRTIPDQVSWTMDSPSSDQSGLVFITSRQRQVGSVIEWLLLVLCPPDWLVARISDRRCSFFCFCFSLAGTYSHLALGNEAESFVWAVFSVLSPQWLFQPQTDSITTSHSPRSLSLTHTLSLSLSLSLFFLLSFCKLERQFQPLALHTLPAMAPPRLDLPRPETPRSRGSGLSLGDPFQDPSSSDLSSQATSSRRVSVVCATPHSPML